MAKHRHWLPQLIATASKYDAAGTKFLEGHILEHIVNGRIHAEIHPFRSEDGGTRSSRFSYSNPPLQQMPSRDHELGPLIRNVFLPEVGEFWAKPDVPTGISLCWCTTPSSTTCRARRKRPRPIATIPTPTFIHWSREMTGLERSDAEGDKLRQNLWRRVKKFAEMIGKPLDEAQAIVTPIRPQAAVRCGLSTHLPGEGIARRLHRAL